MKKILAVLIVVAAIAAAALSAQGAVESVPSEETVRIGISKLMVHPALDSIEEGIRDYLTEHGINAEFETQTANGEVSTAISIARLFETEGKDLVIGIATPTAQALANVF